MKRVGAVLSIAFLALCQKGSAQTLVAPERVPYEPAYDISRGVLSYADLLEPVLSSTVRIYSIGTNSDNSAYFGSGSGVVFDAASGFILTNSHVVQGTEILAVELYDGNVVEAEIVGVDPVTDLAVLKAELPEVSQATFVDSNTIRVGDMVFAVGYPRGLDLTVSSGLVSGLKRHGFQASSEPREVEDFIQTDAPINPGNSGGPLVDSRGRVVGINTFIFRDSDGIGFAVPSNIAAAVARKLAERGTVERGYLGLTVQTLTPSKASALGIKHRLGALVTLVTPASPADRAGLEPGDIVTGLPGVPVRGPMDVVNFALLADPGVPHTLYFRRNDEAMTTKIIPLIRDSEKPTATTATAPEKRVFGAVVRDGLRNLSAGHDAEITVVNVLTGSLADRRGLKAGDVILSVNRQPVKDTADLFGKLKDGNSETIALLVRRGSLEFLALF